MGLLNLFFAPMNLLQGRLLLGLLNAGVGIFCLYRASQGITRWMELP
jgi:hypothetical protein